MHYWTGHELATMRFVANDGRESPVYGKEFNLNKSYSFHQHAQMALTKITIFKNNYLIIGLKFTYEDGNSDEFQGTNGAGKNKEYGEVVPIDVDLREGEILVGVTVEQDERICRCIGFTFMRTR